jgi:two-component system, chemotaxis family, protein-glutamate methylesterase/glutaminase
MTERTPIRVLIVDDSAFMRAALSRMIASNAGLEVVATAASGADALDRIPALNPDVVTLDVEMPGLDGLATLQRIMHRFPRPVIMVSAATEKSAEITFQALSAGAFDYIPKQLSETSLDIDHIRCDLVAKIRAAVHAPHAMNSASRKPPRPAGLDAAATVLPVIPDIVALGVSTGGPKALQEILPRLPHDFPVPILIVRHMPAGFTAPFAQRLNSLCSITVREAAHRELIQPATAYIAPTGLHMRVVRRLSDLRPMISLDRDPSNTLHIPSVDVLMDAVAMVYGNRALGVIMTGMGSDGALGMKAIYRAGGFTIGQDKATCTVYGMPRACAEQGILSRIVPLGEIPREIIRVTRRRKRAS